MNDYRNMAVLVIQRSSKVGVEIFQSIREDTRQTIGPPRINHIVVRGFELVPFESSGILSILVKLGIQTGRNKQKQDEDHPAFAKLIVY